MTKTWTSDDLVGWLAHDLRTPLGAITGFAEALLEDSEMAPDAQREFLGIIYSEAQRLARLVEQAVRLVRLEREAATWQISDLPLSRWLEEGQQRAAPEIDALGVTVELLSPEEDLTARGADRPLTDALAGLLVGVSEFAGPGATLRLAVSSDESTITLTLCSDAFSLSDDEATNAFQPFQRSGNAPRHDPVAAGMELALCAAIVARHGGRVWARPEGEGSCFGIVQPLTGAQAMLAPAEAIPLSIQKPAASVLREGVAPIQPSASTDSRPTAGVAPPHPGPQPVNRDHILVVDDQPFIRRSLSLALRRAGYQVSDAVNGAEGLEQIRAQRPGLVFLDLMMPVMDGFEACRRVRADPALANTRIIMLTAKGEALDEERGLALGVDEYITKPFSPSAVVSRVREILG
ncbi:MAG: hybrid sensor histidine kinase/response regulator [Chloroflexota bacterium]|nr:hybrid sensor histidine kinase/response regulator [Chloroflexota bacterium]